MHSCKHKQIMRDIQGRADIEILVDTFYQKVRANSLLSPIFGAKIPDEAWPSHLQRMYSFWSAILFAEKGFDGNPMQKHLKLPVEEKHFSQWLHLFIETVDENFHGPKAEEAKQRAATIAQVMNFKINTLRS